MKCVTACAFLLICAGSTVVAQEPVLLKGRVMVGDSPVAGQVVSLHRVTPTGGETLAVDTSDAQGNFAVELGTPASGALHFVATRYQGKLYTGEIMRDEFPESYMLRVGAGATPLDFGPAATTAPPGARRPSPQAAIAIVAGAILALAGIFALAAKKRAPVQRQLLVEIADLDNRNDAAPIPQYAQQREELLRRLRESA